MKEELISRLEGGRRWSRGKVDRLYFDDEALGFEYECYKSSGRISSAEIKAWPYLEGANMEAVNAWVGKKLSNKMAMKLAGRRHFIDLTMGKICSFGFFRARIKYLILKAERL